MTSTTYDPSVAPPTEDVYDLGEVTRLDVGFPSDGYAVAGHAYLPAGPQEFGPGIWW